MCDVHIYIFSMIVSLFLLATEKMHILLKVFEEKQEEYVCVSFSSKVNKVYDCLFYSNDGK